MTTLSAEASASSLVPGDPGEVAWLAREYGRYAGGAGDAARTLRRIDTGAWVGPAGDAFREAIGELPDKLERGSAAFARASSALSDYARVLADAQADAAAAVSRFAEGEAATARWQATPEPAGSDPGAADRRAAEQLLGAAREGVERAARRTAAVVDDARGGAPREPGLLSKAVDAVGSFVAGAGEATWGLVELAYKLSPSYALTDPAGFVQYVEGLGKGVVYGVQHPKELGKAMVDWDTWADDPARALGHLVPDLVLAVVTVGGGEAGVAAGRAAKGAEAVEAVGTRGIRAAARAVELPEAEVALLEERFAAPSERVLHFQGNPPYNGVDGWSDRILRPGDSFSIGNPGEGQFAATPEAVEQVGNDARRYNEGLQVASRKDPVDGVPRYRSELNTYEVTRPLPVAESVAAANARFGAGGLPQYFLPDTTTALKAEGFIELRSTTPMTNLDAVIGPKGTSVVELVPATRGALAGGATLVAAGTTRLEGCG